MSVLVLYSLCNTITPISYTHLARLEYKGHIDGGGADNRLQ